MREAERIDRILSQLKKEWEKHQDVRLFQLLFKLQYDYANNNEGQGKVDGENGQVSFDNYSLEDDELEEFLKDWKF
ncbi:MAG: hypothetical protein ACJASQ_002690 [Crocinitomicaceae bacterium]|jgi:uncharacterized protein YihD (DUF1040 family)